jgi:hypothetical protein
MSIYMVTHKMRWLNQECRNIYYYETEVGEPSTSEWQDIVDEIRGDWFGDIKTQLSSDFAFYGINYRRVDTAGLLSFDAFPTAGDVDGTAGSDDLPTQVALLVSVKGTTTKPNRARTYLPGFVVATVVNSQFGAESVGDAEEFIDLQSVLNGAGTNPLQRVAAQWNSGHTAIIASNNIVLSPAVASTIPATQRRRRIGVGI